MVWVTAELHVHIEGTLEPELAFDLARRNSLRLPFGDVDELRSHYSFNDLRSFLELYYSCAAVLRSAEDFSDLADAYLDRARSQGVRHAEIFFDPQSHTSRGVPLEAVMEGLGESLRRSEERFGITTGLIACFLRDRGPQAAMEAFEALLPHREGIIGVGLDSAEVGWPPSLFADVFARAGAEGLHRVAHAGEEGPADYIREALDVLGAERIDHGIRCMEDPSVVRRLREEQIPLTVCPLSNVRLRAVDRIEHHPLAAMAGAGLLVTVNSDDPAYFGGYIGDNYRAIAEGLGLSPADLVDLARNSFRGSFLPDAAKDLHLAELADAEPPAAQHPEGRADLCPGRG